jgi:hypothetical protein
LHAADGEPILIPGEIDESFEDTLCETPPNDCKDYLQLFLSKIEHMKDALSANSALSYMTRFPWAVINVAFSLPLQKGQWSRLENIFALIKWQNNRA